MTRTRSLLDPQWPDCPVGMASTTRQGGVSQAPWGSFNLGLHVGDAPAAVRANRQRLQALLSLPTEPRWLHQVHGVDVAHFTATDSVCDQPADAAYTQVPGLPLVILTADCLPVLMASADGSEVGAAHAGWRSLCGGVLERLRWHFRAPASELRVWLGPAIGPTAFEVGPEVRSAFSQHHTQATSAFSAGVGDRYFADLVLLARQRLQAMGVEQIAGGHWCTASDSDTFYSYRRDGQTGRMATLIWRL